MSSTLWLMSIMAPPFIVALWIGYKCQLVWGPLVGSAPVIILTIATLTLLFIITAGEHKAYGGYLVVISLAVVAGLVGASFGGAAGNIRWRRSPEGQAWKANHKSRRQGLWFAVVLLAIVFLGGVWWFLAALARLAGGRAFTPELIFENTEITASAALSLFALVGMAGLLYEVRKLAAREAEANER